MFAKKNEYLGDLAQECRCCCEVSETILIIVVVSAGKKLWPFYCSLPLSLYVEIGQWSIVVRLAICQPFPSLPSKQIVFHVIHYNCKHLWVHIFED